MKVWISLIIVFSFTQTFSQTCIVLMALNDTIVIGADSRVTRRFIISSPGTYRDTFIFHQDCKIRNEKNVFYCGSGKQMDLILDYSKEIIINKKLFKDSLNHLLSIFIKKLDSSITRDSLRHPRTFEKDYFGAFSRVFFVWFENNIPIGYILTFHLINKKSEKIKVEMVKQKLILHEKNSRRIYAFGDYDAIENIYAKESFWKNKTLEYGIKQLFDTQIKATPQTVGYPVSILRLTKRAVMWYNKGVCK